MSRYRRIVLHAGLSKTGSTSIQRSCARYRQVLRDHGIEYPPLDVDGGGGDNHSLALVLAVAAEPGQYILGLAQRYGDALPGMTSGCREKLQNVLATAGDTLLLSTELVENFAPGDMQSLRDLLQPHCDELLVLASFRSPLEGAESLLQERLKAGAVLEPQDVVGRTRRKYENLSAAFPDQLQPVNYHEAREHPLGLVGAFLQGLGLPLGAIADMDLRVENERMSAECYCLMRAINLAYPRREQHSHGVERAPQDLNMLLSLHGAAWQLEQDAEAGFKAQCAQETDWLQHRLGFDFPAPTARRVETLWQEPVLVDLPAVLRELPDQRLRSSAAEFLLTESTALAAARPETARALRDIAGAVS